MKHLLAAISLVITAAAHALPPAPAPAQEGPIALVGATVHVGNGTVISNATVTFADGRITAVGTDVDVSDHRSIDVTGQHLYPGFVLPDSNLGLSEVESIQDTVDYEETGSLNPNIRALIAYNTDSEITPTTRYNGILTAQVSPNGGIVSGRSSIVQLDAWNWEDAALVADDGLFLSWPAKKIGRFDWSTFSFSFVDNDKYRAQMTAIEAAFADARAYIGAEPDQPNVKLEAMRGLFDGSMRLYLRVDGAVDIARAVSFARGQGVEHVVVLGRDGLLDAADFLAKNDVPAIVTGVHRLPQHGHSDVDAPYRLPAELVARGVKTGLTYPGNMSARNLPFIAGTASAYGLGREEALRMITLTNAEIIGVADRLGSIEAGKDATLFVSSGDALDMRGNNLTHAFIGGREVTLDGMQQELYRRYLEKYSADDAGN